MDRDTYLTGDNWYGSFYELAMEYVPRGDDARLLNAMTALWGAVALDGPWQEKAHYGQSPSLPVTLDAENSTRLYGVLHLSEYRAIGCLSITIREDRGSD